MEQRSRRQQPAVVEHRLRQPIGVDTDVDPAEQSLRRRDEAAAGIEREPHAARARRLEQYPHPFGVAAQRALLEAQRDGLLEQARRGQRRQQLRIDDALDVARRRRHVADTPAGREDLGEAGHVQRALQAVERRQPRRVSRRQVRIGVVLHDREVAGLGQLQHLMRSRERQGRTGRVVQHRHGRVQARMVLCGERAHHREIRTIGTARHRQQLHAEPRQPRVLDGPAGFVDQHRIARLQQRARDQVERMRRADGGDDLRSRRGNAHVAQAAAPARLAAAARRPGRRIAAPMRRRPVPAHAAVRH